MTTLDIESIERQAHAQESIEAYSPLDQLCYIAFDGLYRKYSHSDITKAEAVNEKRKIRAVFVRLQNELSGAHELSVKYADGIKKTDEAVSKLCKDSANNGISDCDLLITACEIIDTLLGGSVTKNIVYKNRR